VAVWLCRPAERGSLPLSLLSIREIEHRLLCDGSGGSVPLLFVVFVALCDGVPLNDLDLTSLLNLCDLSVSKAGTVLYCTCLPRCNIVCDRDECQVSAHVRDATTALHLAHCGGAVLKGTTLLVYGLSLQLEEILMAQPS